MKNITENEHNAEKKKSFADNSFSDEANKKNAMKKATYVSRMFTFCTRMSVACSISAVWICTPYNMTTLMPNHHTEVKILIIR